MEQMVVEPTLEEITKYRDKGLPNPERREFLRTNIKYASALTGATVLAELLKGCATVPVSAESNALKITHLNPKLKPSTPLYGDRKELAERIDQAVNIVGGKFYPIWVDVVLESKSDYPIELVDYIVRGSGGYAVTASDRGLELRLNILGRILNPHETRRVKDYPIATSATWRGSEFDVHYTFKIPAITRQEMTVAVKMRKI